MVATLAPSVAAAVSLVLAIRGPTILVAYPQDPAGGAPAGPARGPPLVPHSQGWAPPSSVGDPTCSAPGSSPPNFGVTAVTDSTIIAEANAEGAASATVTGDEARKSPTAQV